MGITINKKKKRSPKAMKDNLKNLLSDEENSQKFPLEVKYVANERREIEDYLKFEDKNNVCNNNSNINENADKASETQSISHAHFGKKNKNNSGTYVIESDNPIEDAEKLYNILSQGGSEVELPRKNGVYTILSDGTVITFRKTSKSGPPAIDINTKNTSGEAQIKTHKIHFILKGE